MAVFLIQELPFQQKEWQEQEQQQQEEKVAEITSLSMGFSREFLGAILMLFRPSLPWCFPIRELSFEQKE